MRKMRTIKEVIEGYRRLASSEHATEEPELTMPSLAELEAWEREREELENRLNSLMIEITEANEYIADMGGFGWKEEKE